MKNSYSFIIALLVSTSTLAQNGIKYKLLYTASYPNKQRNNKGK